VGVDVRAVPTGNIYPLPRSSLVALDPARLLAAKYAYTTRYVAAQDARPSRGYMLDLDHSARPQPGDVVGWRCARRGAPSTSRRQLRLGEVERLGLSSWGTIRTWRSRWSTSTACPSCTASATRCSEPEHVSGPACRRTAWSSELERHRVAGLDLRLIEVDNAVVGYQPRPAGGADAEAFLAALHPVA
jgi:hypothetical protein